MNGIQEVMGSTPTVSSRKRFGIPNLFFCYITLPLRYSALPVILRSNATKNPVGMVPVPKGILYPLCELRAAEGSQIPSAAL